MRHLSRISPIFINVKRFAITGLIAKSPFSRSTQGKASLVLCISLNTSDRCTGFDLNYT